MDLDVTVIIPAILFTIAAIYLASSLLNKKPNASSSSVGNKKPTVGYGDDIPPSKAVEEHLPPEPEASPRQQPPSPPVEDIGAAEKVQGVKAVPDSVSASEPVPEPVKVPEPASAPEPFPEPASVSEPVQEPAAVPEPVAVPDPEPVVKSESVSEAVLQSVEKSLSELIPGSAEDSLPNPEPLAQASHEAEPEIVQSSDATAADDTVKFTPGKKQSKYETLMTKEEIEEEQRVQQEQLMAIFLLLREKGKVTDGDVEEQSKLYSS
uniref:matrix-remodeling-associated protein 7 isoform X2 n=1 Tax=Monopterus albus TaxID=43700 RepID=UPI0009B4B0AB|nr:matrix-remodeling-associated protein 7 isoform X2 [Monopterus albus]